MLRNLFAGRTGYLIGFLASFGLVGLALFIQTSDQLEPCPLCISQRIAYMTLGVAFLLAALHNPASLGRKLYGVLQFVAAATGAGIAARHIWIQHHPDEVLSECGAGIGYLFERLPLQKALQLLFQGSGECSAIDWTLFGFSMPEWSLAAFVGFALWAVLLAFAGKKR